VLLIDKLLILSDGVQIHINLITEGEYILLQTHSEYKVVKYVSRHAMSILHLLRLSILGLRFQRDFMVGLFYIYVSL